MKIKLNFKTILKLKRILLASGIFLICPFVHAQNSRPGKFDLSLGIESGVPTTDQSNYTSFILGGTVRLQYGLTSTLAATFTTGGYHFFPKTIPGTTESYASFGVGPVKAGLKQFVSSNIYLGFEGGVGVEVTQLGFSGGQKKLLLSPAVGYANKHWDIAAHFESLTGQQYNYGIFTIRVAYCFGL